MAPLIELTDRLRQQQPEWEVPDLDPASGGLEARALFLLQKPGSKTSVQHRGSGFISVNNNDATAQATHGFAFGRNGLPLGWCLFANVIPWWDDNRKVSAEQRQLARGATTELLQLLPALRAVVLVGAKARDVWSRGGLAVPDGARLWASDHPSPQVRAAWPERWAAIRTNWPALSDLEPAPTASRVDAERVGA